MRGTKDDNYNWNQSGSIRYRYLWHNMVSGQQIEISEQDFKTQTEPPL